MIPDRKSFALLHRPVSADSVHRPATCCQEISLTGVRQIISQQRMIESEITQDFHFGKIHNWLVAWCMTNPPFRFRPSIFALTTELRAKIFELHAKSKIWAQKIDESSIRWNCRIRKSVKISPWIRNLGKNIFKIRRSVRLFTPLYDVNVNN